MTDRPNILILMVDQLTGTLFDDGPAAFLILIVGGFVAMLAIWLELAAEPPFYVHALLWIPLATMLTLGGLRVAKAALLASAFRNRAGEGRLK